MRITLACEQCDTPFSVTPYQAKTARFCSKRCSNIRTKLPDIIRICGGCQQPFVVPHRSDNRDTQLHCSRACSNKVKSHPQKGMVLSSFWDNVQRCEHEFLCPYCCWPWPRQPSARYPTVIVDNVQIGVHRLAWSLGNAQPFPAERVAAHYCHMTRCCNPIHIHPATQQENIGDSIRDQRQLLGEHHPNSKLTEAKVRQIFSLQKQGFNMLYIADYIGISHSTVGLVLHRQTWKHIDISDI